VIFLNFNAESMSLLQQDAEVLLTSPAPSLALLTSLCCLPALLTLVLHWAERPVARVPLLSVLLPFFQDGAFLSTTIVHLPLWSLGHV
jgi:hypothetical protein